MARPLTPTDAELRILRVIWKHGPSTVREVWRVIHAAEPLGYTSILKLMQIMTEKGLLRRDERASPQRYFVRQRPESLQRRMVGDLIDKAFEGSAALLVARALERRPATADELEEIRRLIESMQERG